MSSKEMTRVFLDENGDVCPVSLGQDLPESQTDWEALRRMSDEEVERRALADPDAQPLNAAQLAALRPTEQR